MFRHKTGLGRGLGALIPTTASALQADDVDIDLIVPNPEQPRGAMDPQALEELAASIREHGILQPLVVSRRASDSGAVTYQLIAGERRWQAARMAGHQRVPVVIREASAQDMLALALIENVQRADLTPLEEALAFRRLVDEYSLTQEEVAQRVGKSRVTITNTLRLLGLPDSVRVALAASRISEGHARALLGLREEAAQLKALELIEQHDLTVRQTEEMVRRSQEATHSAAPARPVAKGARRADPQLEAIARRLTQALGTHVAVEKRRRLTRVVIDCHTDEQLDQLLSLVAPADDTW